VPPIFKIYHCKSFNYYNYNIFLTIIESPIIYTDSHVFYYYLCVVINILKLIDVNSLTIIFIFKMVLAIEIVVLIPTSKTKFLL